MNKKLGTLILPLACMALLSGCGTLQKMKARTAMEAVNRGDIETFLKDWADDGVLVYPGDVSTSGEVRGKEAIREWLENWRDMFPDLEFTIRDIYLRNSIYLGMTNVIAVHIEASGTNKFGDKVGSSSISLFTIRGTKIVRLQDFIFDAHRLREFWGE